MNDDLITGTYETCINKEEQVYTIWSASYHAAIENKDISDYEVDIDPDKVYTVNIDDIEQEWSEQKLWDWMVDIDFKLDYASTRFGDQEMVFYTSKPREFEEINIQINGPGSSCGTRVFEFPRVKINPNAIDYDVE